MWPISFTLPDPVPPAALATLPLARFANGYDQTPVPTRIEIRDGTLVAARALQESGFLLVPWPVEGAGVTVVSTATIRERAEPYNLILELARGKLNQVRQQTAEWVEMGLAVPPEFDARLADLTRRFGKAVHAAAPADGDPIAAAVLTESHALADRLLRMYTDQLFATRIGEDGKLTTRFAARASTTPFGSPAGYATAFNAAQVAVRWRDVEPQEARYDWAATDKAVADAEAAGLPITGGPVIDLAPGMLPEWAAGWKGDLLTLAAFVCDFLETVVRRYKNRVRRWVVCAGVNQADALGLSDDDRFRLVARLFEAAGQIDPKLELVLGVAHPWGDYMASEEQTISPLAFADDLSRLGVRLAAVEVELRNGTLPRGSLPRDLLETSRVLDLFGVLGLPLEVVLSGPAAATDPAAAVHGEVIWEAGWPSPPSPEAQAAWGAAFAELALCKPHVRAVTWDHWSDADPHLTPAGGLLDAAGAGRPLLGRLRALRRQYLA
jgi:hypothetical protein